MMQKEEFLSQEGDSWFQRNRAALLDDTKPDPVIDAIGHARISFREVLEIGCSNGWRLNRLRRETFASCAGIDPSRNSIEDGRSRFPQLLLEVGTADQLPFSKCRFDLIIFGFCLYLCDREDLFRIAQEADRCLQDPGTIIIYDFCPPFPYKNIYKYNSALFTYKMDYSRLFSWNPAYTEIYRRIFAHASVSPVAAVDERVAVIILRKDSREAYPQEPFEGSSD